MFTWLKKTAGELNDMAKSTFNTPAPLGKTILITGGLVIGVFLITHKMKVILIFE